VFGDNLDDTVATSRDAGGQIVSARGFSELEPERVIRACADRQAISECLLCGRQRPSVDVPPAHVRRQP
jgi:hypothetical protein